MTQKRDPVDEVMQRRRVRRIRSAFVVAVFGNLFLCLALHAQRVDESPFQIPPSNNWNQLIGGLDYDAPAGLAFDSRNRPYMMNVKTLSEYGFIRTMDNDGNWVNRSYMSALQAWNTNAVLPSAAISTVGILTVDADDDLYALVPTYRSEGGLGPFVLLYSTDGGVTFQVYELPPYTGSGGVTMEAYSGWNRSSQPPAIGVTRFRASGTQWSTYNYLSVVLPVKTPAGLDLGTPIPITPNHNGFVAHSGVTTFAFSDESLTHVVYLNSPAGEEGSPLNPTYVTTLNRSNRTMIAQQYVGDGNFVISDTHCGPVIAGDRDGYLHVLLGSHSQPFRHTRSLAPGSITNGWTAPAATSSERPSYTSLVCDRHNRLFSAFRVIPSLGLQSCDAMNGSWSAVKQLTTPPTEYVNGNGHYCIFYHRLFIDRGDALFASFRFYWSDGDGVSHDTYPRVLVMSEDGGATWQLCTRATLFKRMINQPVWAGPADGNTDWMTNGRWRGYAPSWGDTAVFDATGNYSSTTISQFGAYDFTALRFTAGVPAFSVGFTAWNVSTTGAFLTVESGVTTDHTINANRGGGPYGLTIRPGTSTILNNSSGLLTIGSSQTSGTFTGAADAISTLVVDGAGNTQIGGLGDVSVLSLQDGSGGTLALTKTGAGSLTLSSANTFSGALMVNQGHLTLTGSATGISSLIVAEGAMLTIGNVQNALGNRYTTPWTINGTIKATGLTTCQTWNSRPITLNNGTMIAVASSNLHGSWQSGGGNVITANGASNTLSGAGTVGIAHFIDFNTPLSTDALSVSIRLVNDYLSSGAIRKSGLGTVLLSGANTYTGPTTVSHGTLQITGSLVSPVTVASGATLGGTGTISNSLTVNPGAFIAASLPGPALTVNSNLTVAGAVNITDTGGFGPGTYTFLTYAGALTDNGLTVGTTPGPSFACALDTETPGEVRLNVALSPFGVWQGEHFGSYTNTQAGPDVDADGDGMSNYGEFRAGTVPMDSNSVLRVESLAALTTGGFAVEWQSVTGRTYQVLYTDALPDDWETDLPDAVITTGEGETNLLYRDSAAPETTNRLYRVRLIAP